MKPEHRTASAGAAGDSADRRTAWKIIGTVGLAMAGVAGLLYASTRANMAFYKHVDEVEADLNAVRGKNLQVHGFVVDGSVEQITNTLKYRFKLESRTPRTHAEISATYEGLAPDNFKAGSEVVATGTLAADGHLLVAPDGISAKCPSKYEGKTDVPKNFGKPSAPAGATAPAPAGVRVVQAGG